ncbi:SDR family oxidoreductase [Polyangium aurulentum]|uniref:SDR family oxidoreductase n=1 Tax=Polyangium aurulentum TaxID=2567896 RepID=UPI0010ADD7F1|nr:SDR family oxidoreductase [Polyangium aurulentum]UQA61177.1 SDR family NAD(P)-dependent oxidoreductase [Polyangium aurulentum]
MGSSRSLRNSIVVITGASSGIGKATAIAFARRGANLVLAARGQEGLRETAAVVRTLGRAALVMPTDVSDPVAVDALADAAFRRFGRIDVWVNNASVALYARLVDTPPDAFRRVIETNLLGTVHGARAALPYFVAQRRGVLINVSSGWGIVGPPFVASYATSKAAIVSLGASLRQELTACPDIHVCTLLPSGTDTPLYQHAANLTGRGLQPVPPVYPADKVARAIVELAERPRPQRIVGAAATGVLVVAARISPRLAERVMGRVMERHGFTSHPAAPTMGNLYAPADAPITVSGGFLPTTGRIARALTIARIVAVGLWDEVVRAWRARVRA